MGKTVDRETVVTWRCDGCAAEEILTSRDDDSPDLPEGWHQLWLFPGPHELVWRSFPHYTGASRRVKWTLEIYDGGEEGAVYDDAPGEKGLLCPLCTKRQREFLKGGGAAALPSAGGASPPAFPAPRRRGLLEFLRGLFRGPSTNAGDYP